MLSFEIANQGLRGVVQHEASRGEQSALFAKSVSGMQAMETVWTIVRLKGSDAVAGRLLQCWKVQNKG